MHTLQKGGRRMIVQSKRFVADITLWLWLHTNGIIRIAVSGDTLLEKHLRNSGREIRVSVSQFYSPEGWCHGTRDDGNREPEDDNSFRILEKIEERQYRDHLASNDSWSHRQASPGVRQTLYNLPQSPTHSRANLPSIQL